MNDKIEDILELPFHFRVLIAVGSILLCVGGYYYFSYAEASENQTLVDERIEAIELEIAEKKGVVANLPKYTKEVARLDVELAKALKELPDKKGIEQLLARISDRARDAGLDVKLFQPMPEQLKDFYAEVPVEIEVTGGYHQVATFFDEVARLERIVNMNSFDIKVPKRGGLENMLETKAIATSFRFLDESERPKEDTKKKKKRRRRK